MTVELSTYQFTTQVTDLILNYTKLQYLSFVPEIRLFQQDCYDVEGMLVQEIGICKNTPAWATVYPGGLALARYILDNPNIVKDKTVTDFCSGSGIVGIAAIIAGASRVTCVDIDPNALIAIRLNATANRVQLTAQDYISSSDLILAGDPDPCDFEAIFRDKDVYVGRPLRKTKLPDAFRAIHSYKSIQTDIWANINIEDVY